MASHRASAQHALLLLSPLVMMLMAAPWHAHGSNADVHGDVAPKPPVFPGGELPLPSDALIRDGPFGPEPFPPPPPPPFGSPPPFPPHPRPHGCPHRRPHPGPHPRPHPGPGPRPGPPPPPPPFGPPPPPPPPPVTPEAVALNVKLLAAMGNGLAEFYANMAASAAAAGVLLADANLAVAAAAPELATCGACVETAASALIAAVESSIAASVCASVSLSPAAATQQQQQQQDEKNPEEALLAHFCSMFAALPTVTALSTLSRAGLSPVTLAVAQCSAAATAVPSSITAAGAPCHLAAKSPSVSAAIDVEGKASSLPDLTMLESIAQSSSAMRSWRKSLLGQHYPATAEAAAEADFGATVTAGDAAASGTSDVFAEDPTAVAAAAAAEADDMFVRVEVEDAAAELAAVAAQAPDHALLSALQQFGGSPAVAAAAAELLPGEDVEVLGVPSEGGLAAAAEPDTCQACMVNGFKLGHEWVAGIITDMCTHPPAPPVEALCNFTLKTHPSLAAITILLKLKPWDRIVPGCFFSPACPPPPGPPQPPPRPSPAPLADSFLVLPVLPSVDLNVFAPPPPHPPSFLGGMFHSLCIWLKFCRI